MRAPPCSTGRSPRPLHDVVFPADGDGTLLEQTEYAQPALFAIEYALASLWRSWGVEPSAVMGHSFGEYAAACIAGVVVARGRARASSSRADGSLPRLPPGGAMAVVEASRRRDARRDRSLGADVAIAAINAPTNTVVSGAAAGGRRGRRALRATVASREAAGARVVRVAFAARRADARPVRARARERALRGAADSRDLESHRRVGRSRAARSRRATGATICASRCASRSRCSTLAAQGITHYVEVSPHPVLLGMAAGVGAGRQRGCRRCAKISRPGTRCSGACSMLYCAGVRVDWAGLERGRRLASRRAADVSVPAQAPLDRCGECARVPPRPPNVAPTLTRRLAPTRVASQQHRRPRLARRPRSPAAVTTEMWPAIVRALDRESLRGPLDLNPASYPAKWNCSRASRRAHAGDAARARRVHARGPASHARLAVGRDRHRAAQRQLVGRWLDASRRRRRARASRRRVRRDGRRPRDAPRRVVGGSGPALRRQSRAARVRAQLRAIVSRRSSRDVRARSSRSSRTARSISPIALYERSTVHALRQCARARRRSRPCSSTTAGRTHAARARGRRRHRRHDDVGVARRSTRSARATSSPT